MKNRTFLWLIICMLILSCADYKEPTGIVGEVNPRGGVMNKVPEDIPVHLEITKYYRNSNSEWCVAMRVFRNDGGSLPETGYNYRWYWDNTGCNGTDQFTLWSHSTDSRTVYIDGISDPSKPMSRFKFYVSTYFAQSPAITIGHDMRGVPITGCGTYSDPMFQTIPVPSES